MSEPNGDYQFEHPWRALAVCLAGGGMVLLDVSIVNVALPSIRTGLSASESALQWVLSGYALTFGLVPAGRLGDVLGRRRMFGIGRRTCNRSIPAGSTWPRACPDPERGPDPAAGPAVRGRRRRTGRRRPERGRGIGRATRGSMLPDCQTSRTRRMAVSLR